MILLQKINFQWHNMVGKNVYFITYICNHINICGVYLAYYVRVVRTGNLLINYLMCQSAMPCAYRRASGSYILYTFFLFQNIIVCVEVVRIQWL